VQRLLAAAEVGCLYATLWRGGGYQRRAAALGRPGQRLAPPPRRARRDHGEVARGGWLV